MADNGHKLYNDEKTQELAEIMKQGVKDVCANGKLKNYLDTMAKFHSYPPRDSMLIYLQDPKATKVASFKDWQEKFKRQVMSDAKGKGVKIFTPLSKDSTFATATVFDVRHTQGEPLPKQIDELTGNAKNYSVLLEAIKRSCAVPLEVKPLDGVVDGYLTENELQSYVNTEQSDKQAIITAINEATQAELQNRENQIQNQKITTNDDKELHAVATACVVCGALGVDADANSLSYLASYTSGAEVGELMENLSIIQSTANSLIERIDGNFKEILQEQSKDIKHDDILGKDMKIIDQNAYDRAALVGIPQDFLSNAYIDHVVMDKIPEGADFSGSQIRNCTISGTVQNADFTNISIYDSEFKSAHIQDCKFSETTIAHTHFNDCILNNDDFTQARLKAVHFNETISDNANFTMARIDDVSFRNVEFSNSQNLNTANFTLGGTTQDECKYHNQRALDNLSGAATSPSSKALENEKISSTQYVENSKFYAKPEQVRIPPVRIEKKSVLDRIKPKEQKQPSSPQPTNTRTKDEITR